MGKVVVLVGGVIALFGVILSMYFDLFGWYSVGTGSEIVDSLTAFGETIEEGTYSDDKMWILSGLITLIGSILLLIPFKKTGILGGILVLGGVLFYLYLQYDLKSSFDFFWQTDLPLDGFAHMGYGWIMAAAGGLIGLVGAVKED